jgi:hypothetical protein
MGWADFTVSLAIFNFRRSPYFLFAGGADRLGAEVGIPSAELADGGKDARYAVFAFGYGDGDVSGSSHDVPDPVPGSRDWNCCLGFVTALDCAPEGGNFLQKGIERGCARGHERLATFELLLNLWSLRRFGVLISPRLAEPKCSGSTKLAKSLQ